MSYQKTSDPADTKQPVANSASQNRVLTSKICQMQTRLNHPGGIEVYVGNAFLKAIAQSYDPHTMYFTQAEEDEFNIKLSKQAVDFGLQLSENDWGEIVIDAIVPGSSAWNANELSKGDVILEVQTPKGEIMDFACLSIEDVQHFLSNEALHEATFRVRRWNGQEFTVTLCKTLLDVTENMIQSYVLQKHHKIGYIYLPSFYTNADSTSYHLPNGCANDVAKELILLKQEGIEGLIIDLRNNGGGSLLEAIRLAGMFIDYGAVIITESRAQEVLTLKDMERGTVFEGPVVILINTMTASASELFAATLQDYNRAVVVGSNSFGKATSQQVVPLKGNTPPDEITGYLKVSVNKIYRVTGKSYQKTGIIPDIKLPTIYDHLQVGEGMYPNAITASHPIKKAYYTPLTFLPIADLQLRSGQRVASDSTFALITDMGQRLAKIHEQHIIPLDQKSFTTYLATSPYTYQEPSVGKVHEWLVQNLSFLEGISSVTDAEKEINQQAMTNIKKDVYIYEAYCIMADFIDLLKK